MKITKEETVVNYTLHLNTEEMEILHTILANCNYGGEVGTPAYLVECLINHMEGLQIPYRHDPHANTETVTLPCGS